MPPAGLEAANPDVRRQAARSMAAETSAVPALGRALGIEREPEVRQAILTTLVEIGGPEVVQAVLPYLRSDDAALRTGALDVLLSVPESLDRLPQLLGDADPDIRVLAVEIARATPAPPSVALLCRHLSQEDDVNVCAAALDVLAEIGGPDCLPDLQACADRFPAEPFLRYAAGVAMARIAGPQGPEAR